MSEDTMNEIVERLKRRRLELEYSYQDLADKTGLSKSTLQRYEAGAIKNIPLDKLQVLAKGLGVSPEWIMGWDSSATVLMQTAVSKQRLEALSPRIEQLTDENFVKVIEYIDFVLSKQEIEQPALDASYRRAQEIAEAIKEREKKEVSAPAEYTI